MSTVRGILEQFFRQFEASYEAMNTIELSAGALLFNFEYLKRIYETENVIPVLKSNAYGHGLQQVLKILEDRQDIPFVAVDGYNEALEVRAISDFKVLVMGTMLPENFSKTETKNVSYVVQDLSVLNVLTNSRRPLNVHLEFNIGLNRQGFDQSEIKEMTNLLGDNPQIHVEGIMAQFSEARNPDQSQTKAQVKKFDICVEKLKKSGFDPEYVHLAKTTGFAARESKYANAIRPGAGLYGLNLLPAEHGLFKQFEQLKPVLGWYTRAVKLRDLAPGSYIGYERSFKVDKKLTIAVLPIGYSDGLHPTLADKGILRTKNDNLPILGSIAMNHTTVDASGTELKLWDKVEVISRERKAPNSLRRMWRDHGIYPDVVLTGLSSVKTEVIWQNPEQSHFNLNEKA